MKYMCSGSQSIENGFVEQYPNNEEHVDVEMKN